MMRNQLRRLLSISLSAFLAVATLVTAGTSPAAAAGLASCADTAGQTSNVTISASHGQVFYIDSASKLDAAYVGYRVAASAAKSNLWVKIDTFRGGVVGLANPADATYNIGDLTSGSSKTAYFLLKASASTVAEQTHTIHIYSGKPGLVGTTELRSCTFSFLKVKETIKANANKVSGVTVTPSSTTNLPLGSTFTVLVTGDTGTIGNGSAPDGDMIWLSPSAMSSWPTGALRLESSLVKFDDTANGVAGCNSEGTCQFTNQLLITGLLAKANAIKANAKSLSYEATYTFKVIGKASSAASIIPISQISSGTQVKHTPVPTTALATVNVDQIAINATASKSVSTSATINGSNTEFSYTVTVANASTTAVAVDQITDSPSAGLSYVPGSVSLRTYNSAGTLTSTMTPAAPSVASGTTNQIFVGPFSLPAASSPANPSRIEISYRMSVATCSNPAGYTYTNSATATIGSLVIGSAPSTVSNTSVSSTNCSATTVTGGTTNQTLPVEVATLPASSVSNNTATINATVDPNGQSGLPVTFEYGQNSSLTGATVVSLTDTTSSALPYSVSTPLTGLRTGTIYYFRIKSGSVAGEILSFITSEPVGVPTITTDPPSNVTTAGGTLNGTIDPNQTSSYMSFTFSTTSSTLSSGTLYTVRIRDDLNANYDNTGNPPGNPYSLFAGSFPVQVQLATTDLAFKEQLASLSGVSKIWYRANYTDVNGAIVSSGSIQSFSLVNYVSQTITFNAISNALVNSGPLTVAPTSTSGLTVTLTSTTPTVCTVSGFVVTYVSDGDCTLQADQAGGQVSTTYYSVADPVVQTFTLSKSSQTVSFTSSAPGSAVYGGTPYVPTGSATSGLTPVITSATPLVCTVDGSGNVNYVGVGTCTLNINQPGNSTYGPASQVQQSFTVSKAPQTVSFTSSTPGSGAVAPAVVGSGTYSVAGSATSGLTPVITSATTAVCTISGSSVTYVASGTCILNINQSGNSNYNAASQVQQSFVVDGATRTLTLPTYGSYTWSDVAPNPQATASADDSDPKQYSTVTSASDDTAKSDVCSYVGGVLTFIKPGDCWVKGTVQQGNRYKAASNKTKITIVKRNQSLTLVDKSVGFAAGSNTTSMAATSDATTNNSGLGKTYSINSTGNTANCTIDSATGAVSYSQAGECSIDVSASGNDFWNSTSITKKLTISRANRVLRISSGVTGTQTWGTNVNSVSTTVLDGGTDATDGDSKTITTVRSGSDDTVDTSVCTFTAGTGILQFNGPGICWIKGSIGIGNKYNASSDKTSITVGKRDRSLSISTGVTGSPSWGSEVSSVTSSVLDNVTDATDGDTKSYTTVTSSTDDTAKTDVCEFVSGKLQFKKPGDCWVKGTIIDGSRYNSATDSVKVTVAKRNHNLSINLGSDKSVGLAAGSTSMAAESDADLNVPSASDTTYGLSGTNSANCTVDTNGLVTFTASGECTITATNSGNTYWNSASTSRKLVVNSKRNRTLNLTSNVTGSPSWNSTGKSVAASALDALDNTINAEDTKNKVYHSQTTAICDVDPSSGALTLKGPGTCEIYSDIVEGPNYNAANSNLIRFTVDHANRTLELTSTGRNNDVWGQSKSASATSLYDDGDAKTYSSADSDICAVDNAGVVQLKKPGTCTLSSRISQGNKYHEANSNTVTFEIAKKDHSLTGLSDKSVSMGSGSVSMSANSNSDSNNSDLAATTYSVAGANTAGCSIDSSGLVTFTAAGDCDVVASNSGNGYWKAASLTKKLTVSATAKRTRNLTPSRTGGNSSPATVGSTGTITHSFSAGTGTASLTAGPSSVCTLDANGTITFVGAGTCTVDAADPENADFYASSGSLVITVVKKAQTISLTATPSEINVGSKSQLATSGASGSGSLTYRVTSGQNFCSISGAELTGLKSGKCKVRSDIAADNEFDAATSNEVTLTVNDVTVTPSATPTPSPTSSRTPRPEVTRSPNPSSTIGATRTASPIPIPTPLPSANPVPEPKATLPTPAQSAVPVVKSNDTIATSDGKIVAAGSPGEATKAVAERTPAEMTAEKLGGFTAGAGIRIEVVGARTAGQFVVSPGAQADPIAVAAALEESMKRTSSNFAQLTQVAPISRPKDDEIIGGIPTSDAVETFASSDLENPITVGQLKLNANSKWIKVDASVDTYKPGTVVYLAVTTQPVIFGASVVDKFGKADFSGLLPVDALGAGGHSIRVVGLRELDGVSADANGEVVISDSTMNEIQQFDQGTKATVKIVGENASGGNHLVIREIPLLKIKPWWTIWLAAGVALLLLLLRRMRKIVTKKSRVIAQVVVAIAALPGLILGWFTASYDVMGIAALIGIIGAVGVVLLPMKREPGQHSE